MSRLAAAFGVMMSLAMAMPSHAGTVPPPMTDTVRPVSASSGPLINRPTSTDTFWEQQRKNGP